MRPAFRQDKTTQAAGLLLSLRGGRMSYLKLLKLLYLADREALLRWGQPITFDSYVSMDRGPVLSRTYEIIANGCRPGEAAIWTECISEPEHYEVSLRENCGTDRLSDAEEALLREIFDRYGRLDRWELVDEMHKLPEWVDPQGSSIPISYRDILLAGGKSEHEAAEIENDLKRTCPPRPTPRLGSTLVARSSSRARAAICGSFSRIRVTTHPPCASSHTSRRVERKR